MSSRIPAQRFGIDFFGTLDKDVSGNLHLFLEKLMASGVEVYIISGARDLQLQALLPSRLYMKGKHYTRSISIESFLVLKGIQFTYRADGSYITHVPSWWMSKSVICKENNISVMVDNEYRYKVHFPEKCSTRFILNNYAFDCMVAEYLEKKIPAEPYEPGSMYPYNVSPIIPG